MINGNCVVVIWQTQECQNDKRQNLYQQKIGISIDIWVSVVISNTLTDTYTSAEKLAVSELPQVVCNEESPKGQNETEQSCVRLVFKDFMTCLNFMRWNCFHYWFIILSEPIWRKVRIIKCIFILLLLMQFFLCAHNHFPDDL